jgi:hypothetical protein
MLLVQSGQGYGSIYNTAGSACAIDCTSRRRVAASRGRSCASRGNAGSCVQLRQGLVRCEGKVGVLCQVCSCMRRGLGVCREVGLRRLLVQLRGLVRRGVRVSASASNSTCAIEGKSSNQGN